MGIRTIFECVPFQPRWNEKGDHFPSIVVFTYISLLIGIVTIGQYIYQHRAWNVCWVHVWNSMYVDDRWMNCIRMRRCVCICKTFARHLHVICMLRSQENNTNEWLFLLNCHLCSFIDLLILFHYSFVCVCVCLCAVWEQQGSKVTASGVRVSILVTCTCRRWPASSRTRVCSR